MKKVTVDGKTYNFPDDATTEEMESFFADSSAVPSVSPLATNTQPNQTAPDFQDRVLEGLPELGGMVGGFVGSPGGFPGRAAGATIGGGVGEYGRQALKGEELDPNRIAFKGAEQGLYSVGGDLIGKGAGALARPVMRQALGVGGATAAGKVKIRGSKFPDPVETNLKGPRQVVNKEGAAKVTELAVEADKKLNNILNVAKLRGKSFNASEVTNRALKLLNNKAIPEEERMAMAKKVVSFLVEHKKGIDPLLLREIKQQWSKGANFKATTAAELPGKALSKAMVRGADDLIRDDPTLKKLGAKKAETKLNKLMGLERAMEDAVTKKPGQLEFHKPGTYPVAKALWGPGSTSRLALTLTNKKVQAALRQSPRAAAELIQQLMLKAEPDATAQ